MDAKRTQRILKQCHEQWWGQYQEGSQARRVWVKLTPQQVLDLLDDCAYAAKHMARQVLMRGADRNLHITLQVGNISYHLRCKEAPVLHIIQITR
jgi:hypothetical protein